MRSAANDALVPAPVLHTDVSIVVTGIIARATVRQRFFNPGGEWAEGVYVFPLPDGAAVDHMRMWVGDRIIDGQIQERAEAKRTYERAKQDGRRASLVEQERPNLFTTSVANIAPQAEITVEIEYQETVRYMDGTFRLRFPLVVAPRYDPGQAAPGANPRQQTPSTEDATRIHVARHDSAAGLQNPVNLLLELDAGMPLADITSPSHTVEILPEPAGRYLVALRDGDVPADRDFVLAWTPALDHEPHAVLYTEERDDGVYALCMIMPPQPESDRRYRLPREMVLVIDTSGSMQGKSLTQARQAVRTALDRLEPEDSFNILQFNNTTSDLFPASRPASAQNVEAARRYVDRLAATGGTNMGPAIEAALMDAPVGRRVRQVVFLTDGAVGNEDDLFEIIAARLGENRLFTVGIGAAPNGHFMRRAAQFGRGTFTYIGNTSEVEDKVAALLHKLEWPALSDIELTVPGDAGGEWFPARIPDLYLGEPVVVAGWFPTMPARVTLGARLPDRRLTVHLDTASGESRAGVSVLWARRKIAALMDQRHTGVDADVVRSAVLEVALRHHLVSKYTSLVAVDVTPVRPSGADVNSHALKANMPHGRTIALPQTATWAPRHLRLGALWLSLAMLLLLARRRFCRA